MATHSHASTHTATALWLAAAFFLALAFGRLLQVPFRQGLFLVVVCVGIVLLLRVQRSTTHAKAPVPKPLLTPQAKSSTTPNLASGDTRVAVSPAEKLSPTQAREWLDRFLVQQQKKQ